MSVYFYPAARPMGGDPLWEIGVDDPGHGCLWLRDLRDETAFGRRAERDLRVVELAGAQLGEVLAAVTAAALTDGHPWSFRIDLPHGVPYVYPAEARAILPSLQRAVIYAATRSEFAERLLDPKPGFGEYPREPVCADCGEGHAYTSDAGRTSRWCAEHGHRAFGTQRTWSAARDSYERDLAIHERLEQARRERAAVSP